MLEFSSLVCRGKVPRNVLAATFIAMLIAILSACGSGGENATSLGISNPNAAAGFVEYKPTASTISAKSVNSTLVFEAAAIARTGQGCTAQMSNKTVYEQTHTVIFAADGVSDAEQQEVAQYAEQAAIELRAIWPNESSTGFYQNKKVHVCVQREAFNGTNPAAAATLTGNLFAGAIYIQSPTTYFSKYGSRSSISNDYKQPTQEIYRRTLAHEMTHLVQHFRSAMPLDQWFTEGIARWIEFGKIALSKNEILALIALQNPISIAWPMSDSRPALSNYSASAAVVTYLFASNGANNPISAFSTMLDNITAAERAFTSSCFAYPGQRACLDSNYEERRSATFVKAFENSFKERDGTPMKLTAGVNNLQDTLTARIAAFW
jgi:hypothetical protein